jgi:shikimate kinase
LSFSAGVGVAAGNLILIGMPGAGKSTVGALLAQALKRPFVDTDALIESAQGVSLQTIVNNRGHLALRAIEETLLCALDYENHVIATGGSAVYSAAAMQHLRQLGAVIYLQLDLPTVAQRIANFSQRGLVRRSDQSLADLYRERVPLYERYADIAIACSNRSADQVCDAIVQAMAGAKNTAR